jgi:hypothetical protein
MKSACEKIGSFLIKINLKEREEGIGPSATSTRRNLESSSLLDGYRFSRTFFSIGKNFVKKLS